MGLGSLEFSPKFDVLQSADRRFVFGVVRDTKIRRKSTVYPRATKFSAIVDNSSAEKCSKSRIRSCHGLPNNDKNVTANETIFDKTRDLKF